MTSSRTCASLAQPSFTSGSAPRRWSTVPGAPRQPIFFSHLIHAGSFQIDCQFCHADARRSEYAGLPVGGALHGLPQDHRGAGQPGDRARSTTISRRGEPIPWVRVFKIPEFTHFPHKPHIRAELACQTCHGPIERMRVVGAQTGPRLVNDLAILVGLRPPPPPLSMGWCVDCHRQQNATRGTQAPLDCVACHH